jgi:phage-related protein
MDLLFLIEGKQFTLYAIRVGAEVGGYLGNLEKMNVQAHAQIVRRLEQLANHGPSRKKTEFNSLGNNLYEVKARLGPRVIFFYDRNNLVICSHAFNKQGNKTPRKEIQTAATRRRNYFEAKESGQGFRIFVADGEKKPWRKP